MADSAQDRQLPATQRKITKARTEGQVARSRDLGHFGAIGAGVAVLAYQSPEISRSATRLLNEGLRFDAAALANPASMVERLGSYGLQMVLVLMPVLGVVVLAALATSLLCGGWNFTWQPLEPKFSKINPLSGITRMFSGMHLVDTLKACLLALILGTVAALYLGQHWHQHVEMLAMPLPAALATGADLILSGLMLIAGVMAAFALVDVPLQQQMLKRKLRMNIEEMKKEFKEAEGSPEIKARLRQRMRELTSRRMLAAVPMADLRVVAKGADLLALKIRDLARENKVPVLQAPPLARALYAHTEVDHEVPARLFTAVAQVLAWVYQLREAMATGRPANTEAPVPEVPADLDTLKPQAGADANAAAEAAANKDAQ